MRRSPRHGSACSGCDRPHRGPRADHPPTRRLRSPRLVATPARGGRHRLRPRRRRRLLPERRLSDPGASRHQGIVRRPVRPVRPPRPRVPTVLRRPSPDRHPRGCADIPRGSQVSAGRHDRHLDRVYEEAPLASAAGSLPPLEHPLSRATAARVRGHRRASIPRGPDAPIHDSARSDRSAAARAAALGSTSSSVGPGIFGSCRRSAGLHISSCGSSAASTTSMRSATSVTLEELYLQA